MKYSRNHPQTGWDLNYVYLEGWLIYWIKEQMGRKCKCSWVEKRTKVLKQNKHQPVQLSDISTAGDKVYTGENLGIRLWNRCSQLRALTIRKDVPEVPEDGCDNEKGNVLELLIELQCGNILAWNEHRWQWGWGGNFCKPDVTCSKMWPGWVMIMQRKGLIWDALQWACSLVFESH